MGLQPIDLQTMYTQLDKISKSTVAEQQGAQLARAMRQDETQRQEFLRSETVNELHTDNEAIGTVDDKGRGSGAEQKRRGKKKRPDAPEETVAAEPANLAEPYLGQHIDVSG
ncbi:MAG: hypothetical protein Pg6C_13510 [Treponemataceae bacterium]|nr:MAG: hypothetical protein Pg6C_13510 [Treponemataceae bacterium]